MDIADKERLSKLLGMLGSSFDGEKANAARLIQTMADKYKLTIVELMAKAHGAPVKPSPRTNGDTGGTKNDTRSDKKSRPPHSGHFTNDEQLRELEDCINSPVMTAWERQFAEDIVNRYAQDYELSVKQLAVVERITAKVAKARQWGRA